MADDDQAPRSVLSEVEQVFEHAVPLTAFLFARVRRPVGPLAAALAGSSSPPAPSESSTLRVYLWRNLRGLGAHYLQPSVCLLPERPEVVRRRPAWPRGCAARAASCPSCTCASRQTGRRRRSSRPSGPSGRRSTPRWSRARRPSCRSWPPSGARGRLTYAEVEESEADLARLRSWLAKIEARDYFGAPGREEARAAVDGCAQALADFAAAALAVEAPAVEPTPAAAAARRLRGVGA